MYFRPHWFTCGQTLEHTPIEVQTYLVYAKQKDKKIGIYAAMVTELFEYTTDCEETTFTA